ncbi:MAG TPA: hypothetical protein VGJ03_12935 [Acidimicrobiales bacterium]
MTPTPTPDTVTEAVQFLTKEGYRDEIRLVAGGLECDGVGGVHDAASAVVDYTFRFEGPSDPGDEAIVLGIDLPKWGRKGVLVSAFGPNADADEADVLRALTK